MALWGYAKEKAEQNAARKAQNRESESAGGSKKVSFTKVLYSISQFFSDEESQIRDESYILFFGSRISVSHFIGLVRLLFHIRGHFQGKTSLILRFLDR